ncbi:MAG: DUF58 domain-containing protein [Cyanobacteria bacterium RM1_2_2]|nr:DUF58 domain-containing protein [Cyanobacteria bacterium RM1_2_2]
MKFLNRLTRWLETNWVSPAYGGWLMGGLALFFFAAATNTMAGWLYVISGIMVAILLLAAVLPIQTLRGIELQRLPIAPVSVGEPLLLETEIQNRTHQLKTLIQVQDDVPQPLPALHAVIEQIPARATHRWTATQSRPRQRGVYRWQTVQLRTAAPLGLFWRHDTLPAAAKAIVYPTVLRLTQCPLVDQLGQDTNTPVASLYQSRLATEGITRTLRPYRWGDSTRLIHWRSSARYGELQVRELETYLGGQELVIGLDSALIWNHDCFEQAVVAAASLYFYALQRGIKASLWTAASGLVRGDQAVLETLAAIHFQELASVERPNLPLLWLTQNPDRIQALPMGSRWLLWRSLVTGLTQSGGSAETSFGQDSFGQDSFGQTIYPDQPLQQQLQTPLLR